MWLFFALLTPFLFSFTNYTEKYLVDKKIKDPTSITILCGLIILLIGVIIFIWQGFPIIGVSQTFFLLISGIFLVVYLIPYFKALSLDDASRVVPLFQITPVFVLVIGYFLLKESLSAIKILGFLFILLGGLMLGFDSFGKGIIKIRKSFWYMVLSSLLYGFSNIFFKFAGINSSFWIILSYQAIGAGIGTIILFFISNNRQNFVKSIKKLEFLSWLLLIINGSLNAVANFSSSYAFLIAPVALVSVVANGTQPVLLIIEGFIISKFIPHIIKEDIRRSTIIIKVVSVVVIIIGLLIINL